MEASVKVEVEFEGFIEAEPDNIEMRIKEEPALEIEDYVYSDSGLNQSSLEDTDFKSENSKESESTNQDDRLQDCIECGDSYLWLNYEQRPSNESPYYCKDCGQQFFSDFHLEKHYRTHDSDCMCYRCNKLFECKADLLNHQLESHCERFMCNSCAVMHSTKKKQIVPDHKIWRPLRSAATKAKANVQHKVVGAYGRCKLCNYVATSNSNLKKHSQKKHPGKEFDFEIKCNECDLFFSSRRDYRRHRDIVHRRRKRMNIFGRCGECHQAFVGYESNLRIHFNSKHPGTEFNIEYKCQDCEEFFKTKTDVNLHYSVAHQEATVLEANKSQARTIFGKCCVCNLVLCSKFSLERHFERIHPGKETAIEYKCRNCDRFFKTRKDLKVHSNTIHVVSHFKKS